MGSEHVLDREVWPSPFDPYSLSAFDCPWSVKEHSLNPVPFRVFLPLLLIIPIPTVTLPYITDTSQLKSLLL
jgi:hypothetical protein